MARIYVKRSSNGEKITITRGDLALASSPTIEFSTKEFSAMMITPLSPGQELMIDGDLLTSVGCCHECGCEHNNA